MMNKLSIQALQFAAEAHKTQVRKYTGLPYIFHPIEVASILAEFTNDDVTIAGALLHDTVEDTDVTIDDIFKEFGPEVAKVVYWVSQVSKPADGSRVLRKSIDKDHYEQGCAKSHNIKLADILSNTPDIMFHDPNFAKIYVPEQEALVSVLTKGDPALHKTAKEMIDTIKKRIDIGAQNVHKEQMVR